MKQIGGLYAGYKKGIYIYLLLSEEDERTQKVIKMRIHGISYFEISEGAGISENSARVMDFGVKKWLKSMLEAVDGGVSLQENWAIKTTQ